MRYRVTYPTITGSKREHFSDRGRAEGRLKEILNEKKIFGLSADTITRVDAAAAEKILAGTGLSLVEVARAAVEEKRRTAESGIPIGDAAFKFIESRASMSDRHRQSIRHRIQRLIKTFAGRTTTSITAGDIQSHLSGMNAGDVTKNNYRR